MDVFIRVAATCLRVVGNLVANVQVFFSGLHCETKPSPVALVMISLSVQLIYIIKENCQGLLSSFSISRVVLRIITCGQYCPLF